MKNEIIELNYKFLIFELAKEELADWKYQFGTSKSEKMGLRITPFAFTE